MTGSWVSELVRRKIPSALITLLMVLSWSTALAPVTLAQGSATFSPPHADSVSDTDGDGYYDYLIVNVNLNVVTAGSFYVYGGLYDSAGVTYVASASSGTVTLATGPQTVELKFSGADIYKSGVSGPYRVSLSLYDANWNWLGGDTHTTGTYAYTEFQPPAVAFLPPHSDSALDTDGDGYYDYLVVNVGLNVTKAGKYNLSGSLYSGLYEYYITYAWQSVTLSAGAQTVPMYFSGSEIRRSKIDGPYYVSFYIWNEAYTFYTSGEHTTSTYSYTSFKPPAAVFSPPHSDLGSDTDLDGYYNYLSVKAKVDVTTAGRYSLSGSLYSGYDYITYAWKDDELTVGSNIVELQFDGCKISKSGVNGPYRVSLSLSDSNWNWLGWDEHTTQAYLYTQFQPPAAVLYPPHSDYGLDTDGDGLYDYLVVKVGLDVRTAKKLQVVGYMMGGYGGTPIDWEMREVDLQTGKQTVELRFDGWMLYSGCFEGSGTVVILLLDPAGEEQTWMDIMGIRVPMTGWIGVGTHTTAWYSYDKFKPTAPAIGAVVLNQPVKRLSPGEAIAIDLTERGTTVTKVSVIAKTAISAPTISIVETPEALPGVPPPPEGELIAYCTLKIENVVTENITFKLELKFLENYDVNTVTLSRLDENWVKLPTAKIGEDENYVYFSAKTTGLSAYAITAQVAAAPPAVEFPFLTLIAALAVGGVLLALAIRSLRKKPDRRVSSSARPPSRRNI